VVLFDEIEKAHSDVLNILLQIMEEGELVDAKGTTYDFSKSVVILTSNLGTNIIHGSEIGFDEKVFDDSKLEDRLRSNLKKILKPELLNRLDEVVVFKRLNKQNQMKILSLLINDVKSTLKNQGVEAAIDLKAKEFLLKMGYSEEYGARALRRVIEKELLDKIAEILLKKHKRPLKLDVSATKSTLSVNIIS
jgi:ATP-dependent Clp protease ATP-binding subunit ClpC